MSAERYTSITEKHTRTYKIKYQTQNNDKITTVMMMIKCNQLRIIEPSLMWYYQGRNRASTELVSHDFFDLFLP